MFVTNAPDPRTGVNKDDQVYLERESDVILNIHNVDGEQLSLIGLPDRLDAIQTELGDILKTAFTTLAPSVTPTASLTMNQSEVQAIRQRVEAEIIANRTHDEQHDCSRCQKVDCESNRLEAPAVDWGTGQLTSNTRVYRTRPSQAYDDNLLLPGEPLVNAESPETHADGPHFKMKPRKGPSKPETPAEKRATDQAPGPMHGGPIAKAKSSGDPTDNEDEDLSNLPPDERVAKLWGRAKPK